MLTEIKKRGRPRLHQTSAERQAAYRLRKRERPEPTLKEAAQNAHRQISRAFKKNQHPMACDFLGDTPAKTLQNIANWFEMMTDQLTLFETEIFPKL